MLKCTNAMNMNIDWYENAVDVDVLHRNAAGS